MTTFKRKLKKRKSEERRSDAKKIKTVQTANGELRKNDLKQRKDAENASNYVSAFDFVPS